MPAVGRLWPGDDDDDDEGDDDDDSDYDKLLGEAWCSKGVATGAGSLSFSSLAAWNHKKENTCGSASI